MRRRHYWWRLHGLSISFQTARLLARVRVGPPARYPVRPVVVLEKAYTACIHTDTGRRRPQIVDAGADAQR